MSSNWFKWFQEYRIFTNISKLSSDIEQIKGKIDKVSEINEDREEFYEILTQSIHELKTSDTEINEGLRIMQSQILDGKNIGNGNREILEKQDRYVREEIRSLRRDNTLLKQSLQDIINDNRKMRDNQTKMWNDLKSSIDSLKKDERIDAVKDSKLRPSSTSNSTKGLDQNTDSLFGDLTPRLLVVLWLVSPILIFGFTLMLREESEFYGYPSKGSYKFYSYLFGDSWFEECDSLSGSPVYLYEMFSSNMGTEVSESEILNTESLLLDPEQSLIQSLFGKDSDSNRLVESMESGSIDQNSEMQPMMSVNGESRTNKGEIILGSEV